MKNFLVVSIFIQQRLAIAVVCSFFAFGKVHALLVCHRSYILWQLCMKLIRCAMHFVNIHPFKKETRKKEHLTVKCSFLLASFSKLGLSNSDDSIHYPDSIVDYSIVII